MDHPRGCGENKAISHIGFWGMGSPPRMRGKRDFAAAYRRDPRITPADAGKTVAVNCRDKDALGSPPRMRGKH